MGLLKFDVAKYFLKLSYLGTRYSGWQKQLNSNSVQSEIENVLSLQLRTKIEITGAGRTDAGVHATESYAHFDVEKPIDNKQNFLHRVNRHLSRDIYIQELIDVKADAHARFDAFSRSYIYRICKTKNPFKSGRVMFCEKLAFQPMQEVCKIILANEDFTSFCGTATGTDNMICKVTRAEWVESGDELQFHISSNRFVMNMVRSLVGTMIETGQGKRLPLEIQAIFDAKDRRKAGFNAAPEGLYLSKVEYPPEIFL